VDRAMEIARQFATYTPASVRYIKRVRGALEASLDKGLELECNLFMDLCGSQAAIERMSAYENMRITGPSETLKI